MGTLCIWTYLAVYLGQGGQIRGRSKGEHCSTGPQDGVGTLRNVPVGICTCLRYLTLHLTVGPGARARVHSGTIARVRQW